MKYYLVAGEASGDLHGSNLMKGLAAQDSQAEFRFWGGDKMAAVGGTLVRHYKETAVMGFFEVISHLGKIGRNLSDCKTDILSYNPDVVILIDYPGFNFKIAEFAHRRGFKVFYYIAPKVWAWKERRIERLKNYVDRLFIIFPFEVEYFRKKGVEAVYEGNPLIDAVTEGKSAAEFIESHSLDNRPTIALFAGSRKMEINFMMPRLLELEKILGRDKYNFILAGAPSIECEYYDKYLKNSAIKVVYGENYAIMRSAAAAVINSGTASLEGALVGVPQVVGYGFSPLSYIVAKLFVKVKYISLANLILDKMIFKELVQNECTAENIAIELNNLLKNRPYRESMLQDYGRLREVLGGRGASEKIARKMIESL